ncbi:MAG: FHA domain-containing protein, partial [Deltaproteobacteria bacterium]|nr:FHA domain-containing protein [Deltaproteobacteria bacterium]
MSGAAYKLRYMGHDIEVPAGPDFVIGRSAQCQLAVDDPLVSRRHVLVRVRGEAAEVEDLGSRNGVYLNGVRLVGIAPLRPGDRITLGSQELMLVRASAVGPSRRETTQLVVCASCGLAVPDSAKRCPHCGSPVAALGVTLSKTAADELTRTAGVFSLLLGVGE